MLKLWLERWTSVTGPGSDMISSILVNVWAAVCTPTGYRSAVSWLWLSKTEMQSFYFCPKSEHDHEKLKHLVYLPQNIVLGHGGPYFRLWKHHNCCEETSSKAFKILCSGRSWFPWMPQPAISYDYACISLISEEHGVELFCIQQNPGVI